MLCSHSNPRIDASVHASRRSCCSARGRLSYVETHVYLQDFRRHEKQHRIGFSGDIVEWGNQPSVRSVRRRRLRGRNLEPRDWSRPVGWRKRRVHAALFVGPSLVALPVFLAIDSSCSKSMNSAPWAFLLVIPKLCNSFPSAARMVHYSAVACPNLCPGQLVLYSIPETPQTVGAEL